ncbi:MAG TPA: phosphate transport system regulatory protein PhoU, partial [Bacteroidetes bacterium]|nr:phosphate transport system regulatory protein PhoU [Bacteroidota bacterium]
DGFIHNNAAVCKAVLKNDDIIDDLNKKVVHDVIEIMRENPA